VDLPFGRKKDPIRIEYLLHGGKPQNQSEREAVKKIVRLQLLEVGFSNSDIDDFDLDEINEYLMIIQAINKMEVNELRRMGK